MSIFLPILQHRHPILKNTPILEKRNSILKNKRPILWFWHVTKGLFFFGFGIHTASETSTAETHTDGGAVIRKPGSAWLEGTRAISIIFMFCLMIVVLYWTLAVGCACENSTATRIVNTISSWSELYFRGVANQGRAQVWLSALSLERQKPTARRCFQAQQTVAMGGLYFF